MRIGFRIPEPSNNDPVQKPCLKPVAPKTKPKTRPVDHPEFGRDKIEINIDGKFDGKIDVKIPSSMIGNNQQDQPRKSSIRRDIAGFFGTLIRKVSGL